MIKNLSIACVYDKRSYNSHIAFQILRSKYNFQEFNLQELEKYTVIITLGGDGEILKVLHMTKKNNIPIFGINKGSIGFLLNKYKTKNLIERIKNAESVKLYPLKISVITKNNKIIIAHAFNEVSLLRQTNQIAKIKILIDDTKRIDTLYADGIIVATPIGSAAYNFAAYGPIIPLNSNIIALRPISPFRPRRWDGALLHYKSIIRFEILEFDKRPVSIAADSDEIGEIKSVEIFLDYDTKKELLFDRENHLLERILKEQFNQT